MDEELTGRQMPHALDAEQAVLGSILIDSWVHQMPSKRRRR